MAESRVTDDEPEIEDHSPVTEIIIEPERVESETEDVTPIESSRPRDVDGRIVGPVEPLDRSWKAFFRKPLNIVHDLFGETEEMDEYDDGDETIKVKKREVFQPILINIDDIVMLSSGIVLGVIFLILITMEEFWYDHFYEFNIALLIVFGIDVVLGLLLLFFRKRKNPRLKGSKAKKFILSKVGLALMIISFISILINRERYDATGPENLIFGIIGAFGLCFFIMSSQALSKWEAERFFIFFIGVLLMVFIPVHETMGVWETTYESLPWHPLNTALLVISASITMFGIYLLRERTGYFGVWLFGIMVLFLIPLHEFFDFIETHSYEPYDQSVGMIGAFLLIVSYMIFFYRYRQYVSMSDHIYYGNQLYEEGDWLDAKIEYIKAYWLLERMGSLLDYEAIWGNMANIFGREGRFELALAYIEIGLDINEFNDVLWSDKGNILYAMGEYRKAIVAYEMGLKINKNNPVLYQNLGVTQATIGLHEKALENYDKAIELDQDYEKAWHNKGKSLHDLGDYQGALKCYDTAVRMNKASDAWLDRGDILYFLGRHSEAQNSYDRCLDYYPDLPEVWIHKSIVLYKTEKYEDAIVNLNKAIKLNDTLAVPYNLLGNTYAGQGKLDEAKKYYSIAVEKNPRYSKARFNLARTLDRLGEDAIEAYDEAVKITTPQRLNKLWFDEAVQYYNRIITEDDKNSRAWKARGDLHLKNGRIRKAISSYNKALEIEPKNFHLHYLIGVCHRRSRDLEEAYNSFKIATELKSDSHDAWNNLGIVQYQMGNFREALSAYNRSIQLKADYRPAIINRHLCIIQLKSDENVESVPLKSSMEDYQTIIEKYRTQGYRVDMLENLIREGKPEKLDDGFKDFKRIISELKVAEKYLERMKLDENTRDQMNKMVRNPAMFDRVMRFITEHKTMESRSAFEKLQKA